MGVLRIIFTPDDLARTRFATTVDPLWEMVLSHFRMSERDRSPAFQPWMRQLANVPRGVTRIRRGAQLLGALAPQGPYFPDFLTPPEARQSLDAGLEALMSTPRQQLRTELEKLAGLSPLPSWLRPLADGDTAFITEMGASLRAYHELTIEPYRNVMQTAVDADRARRTQDLLLDGIEGLMDGMRPMLRWRPPVLEVDYSVDRELRLLGRGLLLVPSFFCQRNPVALADPELPPVLVYPIDEDLRQWTARQDCQPLESLLGRTRASVLHAISIGATSTQLARKLGVSTASVSRHATALRDAHLITSHRHGAAILHTLTQLGTDLLRSSRRPKGATPR